MPKLDIDMFDETPSVGDKVKVMGKIKDINQDTGEVEVSYDDVSIVDKTPKKHKTRNRYNDNNDNFVETNPPDEFTTNQQMNPQSQSLDQALARSFPNTQ